jgi:hypothetical protein
MTENQNRFNPRRLEQRVVACFFLLSFIAVVFVLNIGCCLYMPFDLPLVLFTPLIWL